MNSLTIKQFIKLTFHTFCFLMVMALLNPVMAAEARGQNLENFKVNLNAKNASVVSILDRIENQTDFRFVYDRKIDRLSNTYSFSYQNVSLRSVLEVMAKDARLTFRRLNNTIAIDVKPKAPVRIVEEPVYLQISGTVVDENGIPLGGASVMEKGTTNGSITDFDGNFVMEVGENAVLVVSYLGYKSKEVQVTAQEQYNIQLEPDATQLDDVVVVGYGVQKKSDVTGSIGSVGNEDFNKGIVANQDSYYKVK